MLANYGPFPFFIIPFVLLFILELILLFAWVQFYFRNGIPLVSKSYATKQMLKLGPFVDRLEEALTGSYFRPKIVIKQFNDEEFGFRNAFTSRYLTSGIIRIEPSNGRITIKGHLPWIYPLLILVGATASIVFTQTYIFFGNLLVTILSIFIQWRITLGIEKIMHDTLKNEGLILDDPFKAN